MIILGVDPGTHVTGFGVIACRSGRPVVHLEHGTIRTKTTHPLWERLDQIHRSLTEITARHHPSVLVIEQCFVSKNVQSALKLGHARGAIMIVGMRAGAAIHEYTPGQIKRAVTGSGRADKHQVAEMVRVILGLPKSAPHDASDALAAAICHAHATPLTAARSAS